MERLDWQNCVGVCSDGAALTWRHHGVIRQILDRAPEAEWTHCFLHRESLAAKKMSPELHEVMDVSMKTINFIQNNAVNSRCFAKLCEDIEERRMDMFPLLSDILESFPQVKISNSVSRHLSQLAEKVDEHYSEDLTEGH